EVGPARPPGETHDGSTRQIQLVGFLRPTFLQQYAKGYLVELPLSAEPHWVHPVITAHKRTLNGGLAVFRVVTKLVLEGAPKNESVAGGSSKLRIGGLHGRIGRRELLAHGIAAHQGSIHNHSGNIPLI